MNEGTTLCIHPFILSHTGEFMYEYHVWIPAQNLVTQQTYLCSEGELMGKLWLHPKWMNLVEIRLHFLSNCSFMPVCVWPIPFCLTARSVRQNPVLRSVFTYNVSVCQPYVFTIHKSFHYVQLLRNEIENYRTNAHQTPKPKMKSQVVRLLK